MFIAFNINHSSILPLMALNSLYFANVPLSNYSITSRQTWFSWIILELRMMEVVVTTGAIRRAKLQSNHHHQQTNTQFFYRPDALPVAQPTVSKHWRENITFYGLAYPKLTWGLPTLCVWLLIAPSYLGGNQHWTVYRPDALPVAQPTVSEHWREKSFYNVVYIYICKL